MLFSFCKFFIPYVMCVFPVTFPCYEVCYSFLCYPNPPPLIGIVVCGGVLCGAVVHGAVLCGAVVRGPAVFGTGVCGCVVSWAWVCAAVLCGATVYWVMMCEDSVCVVVVCGVVVRRGVLCWCTATHYAHILLVTSPHKPPPGVPES